MPYLNVDEVESALAAAASAPYAAFTQLIPLPDLTWEGRQCNAIKIANGSDPGRPGVYFLGGMHAREWGSSDILIYFIEQLEQAYLNGTGITLGGKTFSVSDIKTIVDNLDIYVFPQSNPDGRNYSMNTAAMWRKNRRTVAPNSSSGGCVGVDLNRNFDFLWDFQALFAPASTVSCSADPCDGEVYHGPSAFSEPEARNVQWIHDSFSNIGYFVDLHSYGQDILYSWGDDDNQESDPGMNFQNAAYNNVRGIIDALGQPGASAYREYIPSDDRVAAVDLANAFAEGIQSVRETSYLVEQSVGLYPTAGASDDYSYSRHLVDGSKRKVLAYTLEWGTEFQPPYSEMQNIIQEITSGLLAFCLWVCKKIKVCTIITDRSTFGKDEIDAMLQQSNPAVIQEALYVIVDGFTPAELGITSADLAGAPSVYPTIPPVPLVPGMTVGNSLGKPSTLLVQDPSLLSSLQRITWVYPVTFTNDTGFPAAAGDVNSVTLTASIAGVSGSAIIELIHEPNPYELDGEISWLSTDLRVFQVKAGDPMFGATMGNAPSDASTFIKQVIDNLNPGGNSGGQTFDSLPEGENASALALYEVDNNGTAVFNFALARVRYRSLVADASNVRVFFRLCPALSVAVNYDPNTTYRRGGPNPDGQPIPVLGVQNGNLVTIPCFAEPRIDSTMSSMDTQTDPQNVQTISHDGSSAEVEAYFGCWLDINKPGQAFFPLNPTNNGPYSGGLNSILQLVRNQHQCLLAEIAFDPDPITGSPSPAMSDKLAQRNLSLVASPNPGAVASRRIPSTFEIRPTRGGLLSGEKPDELMIEWGNTPLGSMAQIYLPAISAAPVLDMATKMYTTHRLTRMDDHTLQCPVGGITYVPIPAGAEVNYVGLLTVDLPAGIRKGQLFKIIVRQVTNKVGEISSPRPGILSRKEAAETTKGKKESAIRWRSILGTFQISIPVKTKEVLLDPEERLLSVLRWIEKTIPSRDRWFPVFQQYVSQIAGRVDALGGDSADVMPSPSGNWQDLAKRCRCLAIATAALLGVLVVVLGTLSGGWLSIVGTSVFALLTGAAYFWIKNCRPPQCRLIRELLVGIGSGVLVLALLELLDVSTPHLVTTLALSMVATGTAAFAGWVKKCL